MSSSSKAGKSRKQKKVQTRIAFEPTGSSPVEETVSPSRTTARVVYDSAKRSSFKATSSQSTAARTTGTAPRTSQAQLSFSSVAHNQSDGDLDEDGIPAGKKFAVVIRSPSANVSSPASASSSTSNKQSKSASFMPKSSKQKSKSKLQNIVAVDSSDEASGESEDEDEQPLKKLPKPVAKPKPVEDEEDDEEDEPIQMSQKLSGRRKPSYLTESDEEPLSKPPRAIVRNGVAVIPGEPSPSPSPPPEDWQPKKAVNLRSFIAGGQLGLVRHKHDYEPVVVGRKHTASPEKKTKKKDTIVLSSDNGDSDSEVEKATASSRKKASPSKKKEADEDSYDSEPAGYMLEHQAEKAGRKDKVFGKKATQDEHPTGTPLHAANEDEEDDTILVRSPMKRAQKSAKKDTTPQLPADSDSEEEAAIMPTPARRRRLSPPPITDDEEELPSKPTSAEANTGSKRGRSSSQDSDLPVAPTPGNKRRKPSNPNSDNDNGNDIQMVDLGSDVDNDSLFNSSPKNKKKEKKKAAPMAQMLVKKTERARVDKTNRDKAKPKKRMNKGDAIAHRIRGTQPKRHRTDKEKALELMRRKRNGEKIDQLTDSDDSEDERKPKMGMYDTDSEVEVLSQFEDEDSEDEKNQEKIRKSLLPQNKNKNKESDDEDAFVVEDDDEPLGVPGGLHDIPIEFTNQAHKKLSEHFKDAVEWMVQRRINPGFNKDDPVYITAFRKLEDDPMGLVNSKLVSTVWNQKFVRALKARPGYAEMEIGSEVGEGRKCEACNRGKHPVSWAITLSGKPYNDKTLEEVDQSDDEDEDEDEESDSSGKSNVSRTVDSRGHRLPPSKKKWYLGSTCKANAAAAHNLIHWKHFLDEWVLDCLKEEGYFGPEKLAQRALWKKKKLTQMSMDIVDDWTEKKKLKTLYGEFKQRIEQARNLTHERWGRG